MSSTDEKITKIKICCEICCSKTVLYVSCPYCSKQACFKCNERFLLDNTTSFCMYCKKGWSNEFIMSNFPKSFVHKKYKEHKEQLLFDLEKAMLIETQRKIELKRRAEEETDNLRRQISDIEKMYINPLREKINNLQRDYRIIEAYDNNETIEQKEDQHENRSIFNKPCPAPGCRGFLTSRYRCGTCDIRVCARCLEIKKEEKEKKEEDGKTVEYIKVHVCNEDTVKTVEMMKKECRSCPKCSVLISKIDGCDMMWCVQCKTAFSWKTGQIETGNIHNPHYWEYLRNTHRDIDEIENMYGEGAILRGGCYNVFYNLYFTVRQPYLAQLIRQINHIENVELHWFTVLNLNARNEELREKYLKRYINENKFKYELQKRNKKNNYDIEMRQILEMLINVIKDTVTKFELDNREVRKDIIKSFELNKVVYDEIKNVINYAKENITKLCDRYNYTRPRLLIFDPHEFDYLNT